jgi:phytoene dehydrogenase-like protein
MKKHIIVIGAGIAGLTASIYAKRSGFDVTLIEQHSIVGGMCTGWSRKGYFFEGAMHWLTGSSPKTQLYQIWRDTGAIDDKTEVYLHEPFRSVEYKDQVIHLYRNIDRTAEHLISVSPDDAKLIRKMVKEVKTLSQMEMPIFDIKGVKAENPKRMTFSFLHDMLHALPTMNKLNK